jgi:integrase
MPDERADRRVRRPPARSPRWPRRRGARRGQLGETLAPATWNRHVATLRSFTVFCRRQGWLQVDLCAGLERRPEKTDRTKALADTSLERLFRREDVPVREKCRWRLQYETVAHAQEVLSPNVDDVDLDNKRDRTTSKGGDTEWLHFQSGSARLLPGIIAGRLADPLFLADRRPAPASTDAAQRNHCGLGLVTAFLPAPPTLDQPASTRDPNKLTITVSLDLTDSADLALPSHLIWRSTVAITCPESPVRRRVRGRR